MIRKAILILILPAMISANNLSGQDPVTGSVTGIVTSFKTFPLNNATVKSIRSGQSTSTDSLGRFTIGKTDNDVLQITARGFLNQRVKVKNVQKLYINLKYAFGENSFKDAVGNGHMTETMLNEALSKYPQKGMRDYSTYYDLFRLIRDEYPTLRVEGNNVFNSQAISFTASNQVLYVVNGMVVNDISSILPNEIQKMEFLQNSAAAEYGVRGANGVLRFTLK
jgi:hypothetical protein